MNMNYFGASNRPNSMSEGRARFDVRPSPHTSPGCSKQADGEAVAEGRIGDVAFSLSCDDSDSEAPSCFINSALQDEQVWSYPFRQGWE